MEWSNDGKGAAALPNSWDPVDPAERIYRTLVTNHLNETHHHREE